MSSLIICLQTTPINKIVSLSVPTSSFQEVAEYLSLLSIHFMVVVDSTMHQLDDDWQLQGTCQFGE